MPRARRARAGVNYAYQEGDDVQHDLYGKQARSATSPAAAADENAPVPNKRRKKKKAKQTPQHEGEGEEEEEEEEEAARPLASSLAGLSAAATSPAPAPAKAKRKKKRAPKAKAAAAAATHAAESTPFEQHTAALAELRATTERLVAEAASDRTQRDDSAEREEREAREAYIEELERQVAALRSGATAAERKEAKAVAQENAKMRKENEFFKGEIKALHEKVRALEKREAEASDEADELRRQVDVYQILTATRVDVAPEPEAAAADEAEEEPPIQAHCKSIHRRFRRVVEYDLTVRDDEVDYSPTRLEVEDGVDVPDFLAEPISFAPADASIFFKNLAVMLQRKPAEPVVDDDGDAA